uniref:Alternative protein SLITRK4 n=1 Tax=Homo sapiens TaxID=9606 RepID=L8EBF6_HUMAN|nr:alternative protein SLITRK4 [Homo sapiens]
MLYTHNTEFNLKRQICFVPQCKTFVSLCFVKQTQENWYTCTSWVLYLARRLSWWNWNNPFDLWHCNNSV